MTFPDEFFRGLPNSDCLSPEGYVSEAAFRFANYELTNREDDKCELSINWNDSEDAIAKLLEQKKPGKDEFQFKIGYCTVSTSLMLSALKAFIRSGDFTYERRPVVGDAAQEIQDNPFHGNLLLTKNASNATRKNVQCALAAIASDTIVRR